MNSDKSEIPRDGQPATLMEWHGVCSKVANEFKTGPDNELEATEKSRLIEGGPGESDMDNRGALFCEEALSGVTGVPTLLILGSKHLHYADGTMRNFKKVLNPALYKENLELVSPHHLPSERASVIGLDVAKKIKQFAKRKQVDWGAMYFLFHAMPDSKPKSANAPTAPNESRIHPDITKSEEALPFSFHPRLTYTQLESEFKFAAELASKQAAAGEESGETQPLSPMPEIFVMQNAYPFLTNSYKDLRRAIHRNVKIRMTIYHPVSEIAKARHGQLFNNDVDSEVEEVNFLRCVKDNLSALGDDFQNELNADEYSFEVRYAIQKIPFVVHGFPSKAYLGWLWPESKTLNSHQIVAVQGSAMYRLLKEYFDDFWETCIPINWDEPEANMPPTIPELLSAWDQR